MKKVLLKTDQSNPHIIAYKEAVRKGMNSHHVLPRNGQWIVKRAGDSRASHIYETQSEAKRMGRDIAKNQGTSLFIYGKDGRLRDRHYY